MDQSAIKGLTNQIDNGTYAKNSLGLLDVDAYGEGLVNFWKSGDFGTAVHNELENLSKIKGLLKQSGVGDDILSSLNTMFDVGRHLQSNGYSMDQDGKLKVGNGVANGAAIADVYNAFYDPKGAEISWLNR